MVTIKDIAEEANVSTATVSYVLNDSAQISKETRKKVLEVAKELRYKGNDIAKSLRTNRTNSIGVIVEDMTVFNSPEIIDGINEYLEEQEFHMILSNLRLYKKIKNDFDKISIISSQIEETVNDLLGRQIDGIIYIGEHPRDVSKVVNITDKPVVYTYCYTNREGEYSINYDDKMAAYEATNYLIESGHKKIGVISGLINSKSSHQRLQGYQQALADNNLAFDPSYVKIGDWTYKTGFEKFKEIFSQNRRTPTAVFAFNDLMAAGVIDAALELGMKVPSDLSVIGFDNREFSFFYKPKLTTVDLPLKKMGSKSAQILINIINNKIEGEAREIKLKCELVKRDSVVSN